MTNPNGRFGIHGGQYIPETLMNAIRLAPTMDKEQIIVITISGRGDKDCAAIARYRGEDLHE